MGGVCHRIEFSFLYTQVKQSLILQVCLPTGDPSLGAFSLPAEIHYERKFKHGS